MSTLSLRTNLAFAVLCAAGLVVAAGMPWYGPAQAVEEESIERLFTTIAHVFSDSGVSANDSLGTASSVLVGLAGTILLAALLCLVPAVEDIGRGLLSLASLAATAVVVWKVFDQPGVNAATDIRYGIIVALSCSGLAMCFAAAAAAQPKVRKPPARMIDVRAA